MGRPHWQQPAFSVPPCPSTAFLRKQGEYDGVNYWDEIRVHVEGRFSLGPEDAKAYLASSRWVASSWDSHRQ